MNLKTALLSFSIFVGWTGSSLSADTLESAPFEARWTGFYAGVFAGYHSGDVQNSDCIGICPIDPEYETFGVGLQAGYDHQFSNNIVVGGYVRVPVWADEDSFDLLAGAVTFTYEPKFAAFIGARVGYDLGNGLLPYVAGGYNFARVEANASFGAPAVERTHHGYHLSLGAEYLISEHVSTDLRYTYSHLGKEAYNFGGGVSTWGESAHAVSLAVNYRF